MWHLASLALKERTKERKATAGFYIFRPKLIYLLRDCENKWKKTIDLTWGILLVGHNICCGRVCHDRWLRGASPLLNVNSTNIMALWKDSLHACIFFHLLGYSVADKRTRYSRWPSTFSVPSWRFWGIPQKKMTYIYIKSLQHMLGFVSHGRTRTFWLFLIWRDRNSTLSYSSMATPGSTWCVIIHKLT